MPNVGVGIHGWRGGQSLYNYKHPNVVDSHVPVQADANGIYEWTWAPDDAVTYGFSTEHSDVSESPSRPMVRSTCRCCHRHANSPGSTVPRAKGISNISSRAELAGRLTALSDQQQQNGGHGRNRQSHAFLYAAVAWPLTRTRERPSLSGESASCEGGAPPTFRPRYKRCTTRRRHCV